MSHKVEHKVSFFPEFLVELKDIVGDILFVYRHFIHWTFSRVYISFWSIILGMLIAFPFFLGILFLGWLDPIPWISYFASENIENEILLQTLATNPYWLVAMVFLSVTTALLFLLASSYSLLLLARLSLKYTERKLLDYKKNLYFSRKHIATFMGIISWNFLYLLAPIMIWCGGIFFLYLIYHSGQISFTSLSYSLLTISMILIFVIIYVIYRISFGYIHLAEQKDVKLVHRARKYLYFSLEITRGRNIWKFLFLLTLYSLFMTPFRFTQDYLQDTLSSMKDALAFKTKLIENIDVKDMPYFQYITKEYESYTNEELVENIILFSRFRIVYFFFSYFVFGGLFILLITSFYKRVLQKEPSDLL